MSAAAPLLDRCWRDLAAAAPLIAGASLQLGRRSAPAAAAADPAPGERPGAYWHDPMVPGQRFDKPGKSPFMDMQLVPVYADPAGDTGVRISPAVQQNLGIRTTIVRWAVLATSFDAVGTVQFDERLGVTVQSRVAGFVKHLVGLGVTSRSRTHGCARARPVAAPRPASR